MKALHDTEGRNMDKQERIHYLWQKQACFSKESVYMNHRICLFRNLENYPFSFQATLAQRQKSSQKIQESLTTIENFNAEWWAFRWEQCDQKERTYLKMLCNLGNPCEETVVWYHPKNHIQIILHDNDHLRIQTLSNGKSLKSSLEKLYDIESALEKQLVYAFSAEQGYYISEPTLLGLGLLCEILIHIPALSYSQELPKIQNALQELGLKIKPAKSINNKILGHLFYVSNATGLGFTETDLLNHIEKTVKTITSQERQIRKLLWTRESSFIKDSICRSLGVLGNCYEITYEEAINLLSIVIMSVDADILSISKRSTLLMLAYKLSKESLNICFKEDFDSDEEMEIRAKIIRDYFSKIKNPFHLKAKEVSHVS